MEAYGIMLVREECSFLLVQRWKLMVIMLVREECSFLLVQRWKLMGASRAAIAFCWCRDGSLWDHLESSYSFLLVQRWKLMVMLVREECSFLLVQRWKLMESMLVRELV